MNDTRKSLRQGESNPLAFIMRTSVALWAPRPRPIIGYGSAQHSFDTLSKSPEAFAFTLQKAAQAQDGAICCGEVKNG